MNVLSGDLITRKCGIGGKFTQVCWFSFIADIGCGAKIATTVGLSDKVVRFAKTYTKMYPSQRGAV